MDINLLKKRKKGLGGSDIAAIFNFSEWMTPYGLFEDKTTEEIKEQDINEAAYWGNLHEPIILNEYNQKTGRRAKKPKDMIWSKEYPFLFANLDGITDCGRVVEIKTSRFSDEWGEEGSDNVPQAYILQVQHYMLVTGAQFADIAVLIGGSDFRLYEVCADKELQSIIIDKAKQFWQMVLDKTPPEFTSVDDVQHKYKDQSDNTFFADDDLLDAVIRLKKIKEQAKILEKEEENIKIKIMSAMQNSSKLVYNDQCLATWSKPKSSKRFDAAEFKMHHIDLYNQYCKEYETTRRFLIK